MNEKITPNRLFLVYCRAILVHDSLILFLPHGPILDVFQSLRWTDIRGFSFSLFARNVVHLYFKHVQHALSTPQCLIYAMAKKSTK